MNVEEAGRKFRGCEGGNWRISEEKRWGLKKKNEVKN